MLLNALESGSGDRVVLLLHGMMGSAASWWKVTALLSANARRVIALDLPGHGDSPRDAQGTVESATAASISSGADVSHPPSTGSILVRADPSSFVSDEEARRLSRRGVHVRSVPGASHTVWYSHFDEFVASVPELFGDDVRARS